MDTLKWYRFFRREGYGPHMAYVSALMNTCDRMEFRRRLDRVARWLNGKEARHVAA